MRRINDSSRRALGVALLAAGVLCASGCAGETEGGDSGGDAGGGATAGSGGAGTGGSGGATAGSGGAETAGSGGSGTAGSGGAGTGGSSGAATGSGGAATGGSGGSGTAGSGATGTGGSGGLSGGAGGVGGSDPTLVCASADECVWGEIGQDILVPADCLCLFGCPFIVMNTATRDRRQQQYTALCNPMTDGQGNPCPIDDCIMPPPLECIEGLCEGELPF